VEEKKVPKLRFKGFVQEWEQRKLGELYKERKEKGNNKLPILSVSIHSGVSDSELNSDSLGKDVKRSEDKTLYKRTYSGDLVFNMMRAWQGAIGVVKNEGMVSPAYIVATPNNKIFPGFMNYYFQRKPAIYELNNLSYGVTDFRKRLYWDSFIKAHTIFPSISEQKKISDFFLKIDDTIALHQRKIEQLKLFKQAFLQKMLANQENVPEIRFADFDVYWEQHTLGETTDIRAGRDYKHLKSGNIPVYGTGGYMLSVDDALSFDKDAIGIGRKGTIDNPYILKAPFWTVDTLFYVIPRNGNEIDFFYSVFQKINWKSKDESTGVPSLSKSAINSILVYAPSKDEQKKIGAFFKYFDENILIHQHKVNLLKQLKKAFLQKMFI